jgi:hypothetical protein
MKAHGRVMFYVLKFLEMISLPMNERGNISLHIILQQPVKKTVIPP